MVGDASLLFGVLALTPIIMLCLLAIPSIEPQVWLERERPPMQWNLLLAIAMLVITRISSYTIDDVVYSIVVCGMMYVVDCMLYP